MSICLGGDHGDQDHLMYGVEGGKDVDLTKGMLQEWVAEGN